MEPSQDSNEYYVDKFKALLDRFCALPRQDGIDLVAYEGESPFYFSQLTPQEREATYANFERYTQVCEEVIERGEAPGIGNQFLWRMFQRLGVTPSSSLMGHLERGDVVEIYNASYVQVFRSLTFFRICSYTLDELLCRPFWELFHRNEELFGRMVGTTKEVLDGRISGVHHWDVEEHTVEEIDSRARYLATVRYKVLSALHDKDGNISAFVNVFHPITCQSQTPAWRPALEMGDRHESLR